MSPEPDEPLTPAESRARKQRLQDVFGEVLPEQTVDDEDIAESAERRSSEDWLRAQVPPHHG